MIFPYHRILSQKPLSRYAKRNSLVLLEVLSGGDSTPSPRSFFSLKNMYMNMDPLQQCVFIYCICKYLYRLFIGNGYKTVNNKTAVVGIFIHFSYSSGREDENNEMVTARQDGKRVGT